MAFTKSTVSTTNISDLPNKPLISPTALKAKFDQYGADDKPYVNGLIDELEKTTGTSGAENIGSKTIVGVTGNTPHAQITDVKAQLDARNAENVKLTGNQTVAGIKTFSNSPVIPTPTTDLQASTKKYVDDAAAAFALGALPDGTVSNAKLASDVKVGSLAALSVLLAGFTSSVTVALNKVVEWIGNLSTLSTTEKTSLVGAVNESYSISQIASFKNKIINGNFNVNQLVKSGTVVLAAGEYGHDMWKAGASGCTYTFSAFENVTTITISAGSLIQIIEGVNLKSGTHVLTWVGTSQGKIGAGSYSASGVTGAVVGGSNLSIEFNTGTLKTVQLEFGTQSTAFEFRPFNYEFALCRRYFEKSYDYGTAVGAASSNGSTAYQTRTAVSASTPATIYQGPLKFIEEKATTPVVKLYSTSGTINAIRNITTTADRTGATALLPSSKGVFAIVLDGTSANAISLDNVLAYHWTADARL